ncbi:MAG: transposase, partial [Actinomycetota bacterium]
MGQVSIGVDIGKTGHYVIALDAAGERIRSHELPNAQKPIDELVAYAAANGANTARVPTRRPRGDGRAAGGAAPPAEPPTSPSAA